MWNVWAIIILIVIGALGTVSMNYLDNLQIIPGRLSAHMCQEIALLTNCKHSQNNIELNFFGPWKGSRIQTFTSTFCLERCFSLNVIIIINIIIIIIIIIVVAIYFGFRLRILFYYACGTKVRTSVNLGKLFSFLKIFYVKNNV